MVWCGKAKGFGRAWFGRIRCGSVRLGAVRFGMVYFQNFIMRYVYLMHRPGTDNYKIGIARSVRYRRFMIDQDVEGRVTVITARRCIGAYSIEQQLHQVFSDRRFRLNAGPNAGRTEWFHFGIVELVCFFIMFNLLTLRPYFEAGLWAALILTIAAAKLI